MHQSDPFVGREILSGQFRILEKVGTGGMGSVYRALQPSMSRVVAIKILHPHLASRPDLISRFRREARALSQLSHPNAVKVFLYGELDDGNGDGNLADTDCVTVPVDPVDWAAQPNMSAERSVGEAALSDRLPVEFSRAADNVETRATTPSSGDSPEQASPAALTQYRERTISLYIVMEYLDGETLSRRLKREGPLPLGAAAQLVYQVCGAVQEAHEKGIVHRDLKPENILLCRHPNWEIFPKVLDFGLAKLAERELRPGSIQLTQEGMVFGTPEFMSPEQAQGRALDYRSDLYSLAVILYEVLTARLPFCGATPADYLQKHVLEPPIPLNRREPDLQFPEELELLLEQGLAKQPQARFGSAAEFASRLAPYVDWSARPGRGASPPLRPAPAAPSSHPSWAAPVMALPVAWQLIVVAAFFMLLGAVGALVAARLLPK